MHHNTFSHKGYGRIYVDCTAADLPVAAERVKQIIKELDAYEFEYIPKDLIAPYSEYPRVVYMHKFSDLDLDKLTNACWVNGIKIWCFDAHQFEYPEA